ncbi:MAG TPA: MCE family protein [Nocardioidaceae bacterium]|nr:MCE family protein [Nocardioidaceae bacterium]
MTRRLPDNIVKLTVFAVLSALMAIFLAGLLGDRRNLAGEKGVYRAEFTDASYLEKGDQVRVAGVPVGTVESVRLTSDSHVLVSFNATLEGGLPANAGAAIRYKNLLGDRYLEVTPGDGTGELPVGATIPVDRTRPAVDLDALTGGFKPLFQALDAEQVNLLSSELIQVFEGQAGAVGELLRSIGSFTNGLADNDQVIGDLITHLSQTLSTLDQHNDQLDVSVVQLEQLISGLAEDGRPIARAVRDLNTMTRESAALLHDVRAPLKADIEHLSGIAAALNDGSAKVNKTLAGMGDALDTLAGIGVYGDFFNFYICDIRVRFTGPDGQPAYSPWVNSELPRCSGRPSGQ